MMPLVLPMVWGPAALVGIWFALTFMQWSTILLTLVRVCWLCSIPLDAAARSARLCGGDGMLVLVFRGVGCEHRTRPAPAGGGREPGLANRAGAVRGVQPRDSLGDVRRVGLWAVPAAAMNLLVAVAILSLDRFFVEASLEASQHRYAMLQRLKRSGGMPTVAGRSKPRMGLAMFPRLKGAGRSPAAIAGDVSRFWGGC